MATALWKNCMESLPKSADFYLVANKDLNKVGMARYMPKKDQWKFPSAAMAFEIQYWDFLPRI